MKILLSLFLLSYTLPLMAQSQKMNFVFLDLCSTRVDHFGTYGYTRNTTPNMDAVAKRGIVFENAFSEGSWCLPSYASLFTGMVPEVHGMYTNFPKEMSKDQSTLSEQFKINGYQTALFSGGIYLQPKWGLTRGFDSYTDSFSTVPKNGSIAPAPLDSNFDSIVGWIGENKDKPFFLFAAVDNMHAPYRSNDPEKYDQGYEGIVHDTDVISIPFVRAYNGEDRGFPGYMSEKVKEFKSDPRHLKHMIAHYDAALSEADQQIGDLLKKLSDMGLDKNTVVVITADHGEMLGEHGLLNHTQSLYEPVIHVPLIILDPRRPAQAGSRMKQLTQRVDLMPTLMEMANIQVSPSLELQGRSIVPLLNYPSFIWRDTAFIRNKRNLARSFDLNIEERVARQKCWKLHHYLYKESYELYNLCDDPTETKEVSLEHPEIVSKLSFSLIKNMELSRPHYPGNPSGIPRTMHLTQSKL